MDLKEEEVLGSAINGHWYYLSKAAMLADHVVGGAADKPLHTLDVGAGSGWFSRWLLAKGFSDSAVCVDLGYETDRDESESGKPIAYRKSIESSDANLVLMMDVLEHVDDDVGLLKEYLDKCRPGTKVFITVPAFMFLWSAHDEFLEHKRRYTVSSLRKVVEEAGAKPLSIHYYFGTIFPIATIVRLLGRYRKADHSDLALPSPFVNAALKLACTLERPLMKFNKLAGLSVVCLCKS